MAEQDFIEGLFKGDASEVDKKKHVLAGSLYQALQLNKDFAWAGLFEINDMLGRARKVMYIDDQEKIRKDESGDNLASRRLFGETCKELYRALLPTFLDCFHFQAAFLDCFHFQNPNILKNNPEELIKRSLEDIVERYNLTASQTITLLWQESFDRHLV